MVRKVKTIISARIWIRFYWKIKTSYKYWSMLKILHQCQKVFEACGYFVDDPRTKRSDSTTNGDTKGASGTGSVKNLRYFSNNSYLQRNLIRSSTSWQLKVSWSHSTGTLDKRSPACSHGSRGSQFTLIRGALTVSEDCLFINIAASTNPVKVACGCFDTLWRVTIGKWLNEQHP